MLAQYLLNHGIPTWYVSGTYHPTDGTDEENFQNMQSHGWLTTSDPRITQDFFIIDITGDQFKYDDRFYKFDIPVYVGPMDEFHKLFKFEDGDVFESKSLIFFNEPASARLMELYGKIMEKIDK